MKPIIKNTEKQEFYWTLKKITANWITTRMKIYKEARQSGRGTDV